MITRIGVNSWNFARSTALACGLALGTCSYIPHVLLAQTPASPSMKVSEELRAKLEKHGDITLRDSNFVEAMFAIRRVWGVNIVVAHDLKGEAVSCEFTDASLAEILDTILVPRGYGYRVVGNSLVVMKLDGAGVIPPGFESLSLAVKHADLDEIKEAASFYLSERGQIQVVGSAKRLVINDYPERLQQIKLRAEELDEAAKEVTDSARAAEIAALNAASQGGSQSGSPGGTSAPGGAMAPLPGSQNKVVFFDLKFTKAEAVAPAIQPLLNTLGRVSVIAKENRLVVYDTEEKLQMITDAVRELDVPRPQVRIAALIYDASLTDLRRVGFNWNNVGPKGNNLTATGAAQDSVLLNAVTLAAPGSPNSALTLQSLGKNFDVTMVVNALAQSKNSRLLADPNITVYDMETAKIDLVTEIPFQQLTQSGQSGPIGTTAFREAGVTLNVTPQIADDDTITMLVNPKFSILSGFSPGTNQPIIDRRETSTTVRARNRETLVIGGLRQRNSVKNRAGIPFLMDMKFGLGELFKNKEADVRDGELVVFITPEVLSVDYLGRDREHAILAESAPSLDSIPAPRIPDRPCPMEDWKRRCGCLCKQCGKKDCRHRCETHCHENQAGPSYASPSYGSSQQYVPQQVNEIPLTDSDSYTAPIPVPTETVVPAPAPKPAYGNEPAPAKVLEDVKPVPGRPDRPLEFPNNSIQDPPSPSDRKPPESAEGKLSPVQIQSARLRQSQGPAPTLDKSTQSPANSLREPNKFANVAATAQRLNSPQAALPRDDRAVTASATAPVIKRLPPVDNAVRPLPKIEQPAATTARLPNVRR